MINKANSSVLVDLFPRVLSTRSGRASQFKLAKPRVAFADWVSLNHEAAYKLYDVQLNGRINDAVEEEDIVTEAHEIFITSCYNYKYTFSCLRDYYINTKK